MAKNLPFLFIIILICGCSSSKKAIIAESLDAIPVVTGSVVNASAFENGGSLKLGPFNAGTGAAADYETDRLSSIIIKGIKEALPGDNTHFTIPANDQNDTDCVLDGHIDDYAVKGHTAYLSVDGEIWLHDTGEKIFLFQSSAMIDLKTQDPKVAAFQMGVAIAHFIGAHRP